MRFLEDFVRIVADPLTAHWRQAALTYSTQLGRAGVADPESDPSTPG